MGVPLNYKDNSGQYNDEPEDYEDSEGEDHEDREDREDREDEYDPELDPDDEPEDDEENTDVTYFKYAFDGINKIDDIIQRLEGLKVAYENLKKEGFELVEPVDGGYCYCKRNPPLSNLSLSPTIVHEIASVTITDTDENANANANA
jgi:hypothetical protein